MKLIVKTLRGFEKSLATELDALGARHIEILKRGVSCEGDKTLLYRVNYESRLAMRVLVPIRTFRARDERKLYQKIYTFDWRPWLKLDETFAIDSVVNSKFFTHSKYAALKVKDAICDQFRTHHNGERPSVDTGSPDLRIHLHINGENCTLLLDSSGYSLHLRGYRVETGPAPLSEVLASGILHLAGYTGERPFIDPMCGSGTFLIEAAMIAGKIPAQFYRDKPFGFQTWQDYDEQLWHEVKAAADAQRQEINQAILGYDSTFPALSASRYNVANADLEDFIQLERKKLEKQRPPAEASLVVFNPPYDERMPLKDVKSFYKMVGDQLKKHFSDCEVWIISGHLDGMEYIGLAHKRIVTLVNGPITCHLKQFPLHVGEEA